MFINQKISYAQSKSKESTYVIEDQILYKQEYISTILYLKTHVRFNDTIVFNILYDYVCY